MWEGVCQQVGVDRKDATRGQRRESGPKIAMSKESFSVEKWMIRHDYPSVEGNENQNKYW